MRKVFSKPKKRSASQKKYKNNPLEANTRHTQKSQPYMKNLYKELKIFPLPPANLS